METAAPQSVAVQHVNASEPGSAVPPPPGTTDAERQYRVLTAIFEDAARSAAGYRSAITFAEQRRERELEAILGDPRLRESGNPARQLVDERYADLVTRATSDHRRDVDALARELRDLTPALPAALAPWEAPAWKSGKFGVSAGLRAGELHLPEAPDLRIPLLLGLPLRRPLWLHQGADAGAEFGGGVVEMARALILRLLAADPAIRLHLCDTDGVLTTALGPLAAPAGGVLGAPIARTREQRTETIRMLAEKVDLIEMACQGGALDALPLGADGVLLVITDVGSGFEQSDHQHLRYLVERAGSGLQIVLLGEPDDDGASADVARASLRLGPAIGDGISDGWVGMSWTFTPDFGPTDPASIVFRS